jgi:tripartite-type tricarboxylate transporter receptor subunit TctC
MNVLRAVSIAAALTLCASALAQPASDYPNKPVKIIVPFAPGGLTDVMTRLAANSFERRFKQPFVVDNRPGGNTMIGIDAAAKSPKDGYTLLVTASNIVNEEILNPDWTVRLARDIAPISIFAGGGLILVASTNIPVTSLRELVAYSKANPGKLNQAEAGAINPDIAILRHRLAMGPVESIVYKGGPLSVQAIIAGEAHFYGASIVDVVQLEKTGKLRALLYTERKRHPQMPHIPTAGELGLGIDDYEGGYWFMLAAPLGVPTEILSKLNAAIRETVNEPEFAERARNAATNVYSSSIAETNQKINLLAKSLQEARAAGVKLR